MTDREELVNSSDDILLDWHRTALASATGLSYWPQLLASATGTGELSDKSILQQSGTFRSHSYRNPYMLCFRSSWTTTCCGPATYDAPSTPSPPPTTGPSSKHQQQQQQLASAKLRTPPGPAPGPTPRTTLSYAEPPAARPPIPRRRGGATKHASPDTSGVTPAARRAGARGCGGALWRWCAQPGLAAGEAPAALLGWRGTR